METGERLQRVLAARGIGSRRKAEDLIRAGRVRVDGEIVTELGVRVDPRAARIEVDGRTLRSQRLRYLLLNKPSGYITTASDERGRRTVLDLVSVPERVYPVGRLDRETDGLLLLTNDGDVANRVMHPRYGLAKEYNVLTPSRPPDWQMERVRRGLTVDGKRVKPEVFRILRETHDGVLLTMTLHEGMNRVVRRLMEEAGISVTRLRRVRIGPLSLAGIPLGTYRDLTPGERGSLLEALRLHEPEPGRQASEAPPPARAGATGQTRARPAAASPLKKHGRQKRTEARPQPADRQPTPRHAANQPRRKPAPPRDQSAKSAGDRSRPRRQADDDRS
ncbi:MAG TPA: pseudouridine synthase [Thermomicrobiales bacterium]|nr:pseudouridine synthase [Thermomicrobiales bacterium]